MQHLSNKLDAAQVAQFSPETIARVVACSRGAVAGDYTDYLTREALIDAWMELRGFESRAQAITDLVAIQIGSDVTGRGRARAL